MTEFIEDFVENAISTIFALPFRFASTNANPNYDDDLVFSVL